MLHFYEPQKHWKTFGFMMFSAGIEMKQLKSVKVSTVFILVMYNIYAITNKI